MPRGVQKLLPRINLYIMFEKKNFGRKSERDSASGERREKRTGASPFRKKENDGHSGFSRREDGPRSDREKFNRNDRGEGFRRSDRNERPNRSEGFRRDDRSERPNRSEGFRRDDRSERPNRSEGFRRDDRNERPNRSEGFRRDDRNERPNRSEGFRRDDRSERPNRSEGFRRDDRSERPNRSEGFRRDDRSERPNRSEGFRRDDRGDRGYGRRDDKSFKSRRPRVAIDRPKSYDPDILDSDKPVRLNKYIANTGLCSRREADKFIEIGLVTVNGVIVTEMGVKVMPEDDVRYNGERINPERKVYLLLNKPKDYVTSVEDPHARHTVMELIEGACKERIYPVGRLDRMTTGVLLFTNDGEMALKLTHPSNDVRKIYQVTLDKKVSHEDIIAISSGVDLEDGFIQPNEISYVDPEDKRIIGIEIHSGRNRIVRRIFEKMGYKVVKLDRVYFAGLSKKGITRGKWRLLSAQEVGFLKMLRNK